MSETTDYTPVSVEDAHGRILTGIGVTAEELQETVDDRAEPSTPVDPPPAPVDTSAAPVPDIKPTRGAKRIDQLTGEREAEKRARETAERERDDLKARIAAFESRQTETQRQPSPQAPVAAVTATRPKPSEDAIGTTYPSYSDFVEDLADWKAEQRLAGSQTDIDARIRQSIEADRASRTLVEQLAASTAKARQVYSDFDAVLTSPIAHAAIWSPEKLQAIAQHPESGALRYHLAKQPDLAWRLAQETNPVLFGMGLAQVIPAPAVASPASTAGAALSLAPPPYQPVAAGSKTTVTPSADLASKGHDFDKSGYREKRAAERGIRRMK